MITEYSKFENESKVGDYVICKDKLNQHKSFNDFLKYNYGEIVFIDPNEKDAYYVKFNNIPYDIKELECYLFKYLPSHLFRRIEGVSNIAKFTKKEIEHFSSNLEDLETIISAYKYNL
jgi:hypothetical protein